MPSALTCPYCGSASGKTTEVRRTHRYGLRRTRHCFGCHRPFLAYGGATPAEVARARMTLARLGYLVPESHHGTQP
jgi:transcriptional regulator NrdR family protein